MATAAPDGLFPLRRRKSLDWMPPDMSELRLVLLGNSWPVRNSVGNFILGETVFNTERELVYCQAVRGQIKDKLITLINTPDLLSPYISEDKLKNYETDCVRLSDPGPHVFLLVLQPEDFSEEQKLRLCSVLKSFSDKSFHHSLILISGQREDSQGSGRKYNEHPELTQMIEICGSRFLELENLKLSQLQKHLGEIIRSNDGEHVSCGATQRGAQGCFPETVKPVASGLRIVLLGKSDKKQTRLGNFIVEAQAFHYQKSYPTRQCLATQGEWNKEPLTVVKTPDLFSLTVEDVRREVKSCVSLCSPGPNVLLLLVKPSKFSEENRQTLKTVLSLFGPDAFKHSVVISTHKDGQTDDSFRKLLKDCGGRHYSMSEDNHRLLMEKIQETAGRTKPLLYKSEHMKPALNLVLCGRRGAEKSSAAEAILGQTGLHSASTSSECVQHQGEVCGRWVSLVDLPALSGKPLETAMKESLRSVSLCDPEGVHAFILVLPVGPLTDEDKGELKIIQDTFGSQVSDFTMILFTTKSDPTAPAVGNFLKKNDTIQELVQSCGGRHLVLNIKDQQQIPKLMDMVEKMTTKRSQLCFTKDLFTKAQMKMVAGLRAELQDVNQRTEIAGADEIRSRECLRMVLIGNDPKKHAILGKDLFQSGLVIKTCQKANGEIDGEPVLVVNTPALASADFQSQIKDCLSMCSPGPHVFLLVLQIRNITQEEKDSVKLIKRVFGKKSQDFIIVLFTKGEELAGQSFESYIKDCDFLQQLVDDCGGRYHVFNDKVNSNHTQVKELLTKIKTMVKENGGCYNTERLEDMDELVQTRVQKIIEEKEGEIKRKEEELRQKHEEETKTLKKTLHIVQSDMERERKRNAQEVKEKDECINQEREKRKKEKDEEERKRKKVEENLRQEWRRKLEASESIVQTERQLRENADRNLERLRKETRKDREAWEKEIKNLWERIQQENKQNLEEEKTNHRNLQNEYFSKRRTWTYTTFVLLFLFLLSLFVVFITHFSH